MTGPAPEFSRPFDTSTLDEGGATITLEAEEAQRAAIARRLDIPALDLLKGKFRLRRTPGGVEVVLSLAARAERRCVVSLEPMTEEIAEEFKLRFDRKFDDESAADPESEWTIEPLEGVMIDLGDTLVQHLSLSLDPNPRKPDAMSLLEEYRAATSPSPFAVLKGLVDRDG